MKYSLYLTAFATGAAVLELLGTRMLFRLCECRLATDCTHNRSNKTPPEGGRFYRGFHLAVGGLVAAV
jgi:hypothetical protein